MKDPKTLSKLLRYSTTAAAVTGVSVVNGQINYEDFTPDINMQGNNNITRVDVNQDGMDDFEFLLIDSTFSGTIPWGKLQVTGIQPGNDVVGYVTSGYSYVSLLQQSSSVFNSAAFISAGIMAEAPQFGASYPLWNNGVTDGYMGFRIDVNGQSHYGWMRLDVASDAKSAVLKDLAFNGSPGDPIFCGQSMSAEDALEEALSVFQSDQELILEVPSDLLNSEIQISDVYGRIIHRTHATDQTVRIDWSTRSRGLYVVSLLHSGRIHSRKVMIR